LISAACAGLAAALRPMPVGDDGHDGYVWAGPFVGNPGGEPYFPLSAGLPVLVLPIASDLSFETGVPLLANPGGG
jgi:hypothetical protein